jgi:peptidyl-prolyl cis-trans isomerase C
MTANQSRYLVWLFLVFGIASLVACAPASSTPTITSTVTSLPPTITSIPMAILVNDSGISQQEFQEELARFQAAQAALGNTFSVEAATQRVLADLTDQLLLEQGAEAAGFSVDEAMLQVRLDSLVAQIGGIQVLTNWQEQHGYTDESLMRSLRRMMAVAWMRDQIISVVPRTTEQVHVQQILLYNLDRAQQVLDELNAGSDFATLAANYDPVTKGELGWFPRNYLPDVQIEEAAFALQPGQFSNIIETQAGFSILMVLAREPDHILSPDALLTLQTLALENWLKDKRQQSNITLAP